VASVSRYADDATDTKNVTAVTMAAASATTNATAALSVSKRTG